MNAARSNRAEVRNPLLALPQARVFATFDAPVQYALRDLLLAISVDARARADKAWRTHKGPMALYWKCVAVYTKHVARLFRKPRTVRALAMLTARNIAMSAAVELIYGDGTADCQQRTIDLALAALNQAKRAGLDRDDLVALFGRVQ